ncbi:MAG: helix-turn-helix transcriptional regulator [Selenomonadaceae bacterium]|nr:helix-turn-helix transcriptional regulator [Selenomonadaceae bacterium]
MTVANALKRFRAQFGLSQKEVAEKVGMGATSYYRYETGKFSPQADVLIKLADAYNVSVDYLLGRTDEPRPVKHDNEQEIKAAFEFRDRWQHILKLAALDGLLPQPAATA